MSALTDLQAAAAALTTSTGSLVALAEAQRTQLSASGNDLATCNAALAAANADLAQIPAVTDALNAVNATAVAATAPAA